MYFSHNSDIWQRFPQLVPGLLLVEQINPQADVSAQLEPFFARARERLANAPESELPEVAAWRRVYSQMGLKPTQYRSAAEALLRRFRKEDTLPALHPLVDLCNAVSLAFALPVAVIDLDGVDSFIEVRAARGDEEYLAFNGEVEHADPGEIIFADGANHAHARRWTFRQSRRSTVSAATRRALIISEAMHATARDDVPALFDALAAQVGAVASLNGRAVLAADAPQWELP